MIDVAKGMIPIEGNRIRLSNMHINKLEISLPNIHNLHVHGFSLPYFVTALLKFKLLHKALI